MTWDRQTAEAALRAALIECAEAASHASSATVPSTPLPRLPKKWGRWLEMAVAYRQRDGQAARLPWADALYHSSYSAWNTDPRTVAWSYRPDGNRDSRWSDAWAAALARAVGWQPAKISRLIRAIERDAAWMRQCADARRRMAEEIMRQQADAAIEITARVIAPKL